MPEKIEEKLPKKGQFVKGGRGGPGRPKKQKAEVDQEIPIPELVEKKIRSGMDSTDARVQMSAVKLAVAWEKEKAKGTFNPKNGTLVPQLLEALRGHMVVDADYEVIEGVEVSTGDWLNEVRSGVQVKPQTEG